MALATRELGEPSVANYCLAAFLGCGSVVGLICTTWYSLKRLNGSVRVASNEIVIRNAVRRKHVLTPTEIESIEVDLADFAHVGRVTFNSRGRKLIVNSFLDDFEDFVEGIRRSEFHTLMRS